MVISENIKFSRHIPLEHKASENFDSNMKIFQTMQSFSKTMGFDRSLRSFNEIVLTFFGVLGFTIFSYTIDLYTMANSFNDYVRVICFTSSSMLITDCFVTLSVQMEKAFEIIDQYEETIEKSECSHFQIQTNSNKKKLNDILGSVNSTSNAIYIRTNRQVESFSEYLNIVIAKATPVIYVWPKGVLCLYNYFTSELGSDAFELPLSMWFVHLFCYT